MHDYFILLAEQNREFCIISDEPKTLSANGWRIPRGVPVEDKYPENTELMIDNTHPGKKIPDLIKNGLNYYIISIKLKHIIEKETAQNIEFLPFTLINHKGEKEPDKFYIANILDLEDCIDIENSKLRESRIIPGNFSRVRKLNLHKEKVNPEFKLFRLKQKPRLFIIRDDFRKYLEKNNISGLEFIGMGETTSIY